VMKAFRVNTDPTIRALIARTLMGRGGTDLITMLTRSRADLEAIQRDFGRLTYLPSEQQQQALLAFDENWKKLTYSIDQVSQSLGAKLAPILNPVIEGLTAWISANRELFTDAVAQRIQRIAEALAAIPWSERAEQLDRWATNIGKVVEALGGLETILLALAGLKVMQWTAGIVAAFEGIAGAATAAVAAMAGMRSLLGLGLPLALSGDTPRSGSPAAGYGFQEGNIPGPGVDPRPVPSGDAFSRFLRGEIRSPRLNLPAEPIPVPTPRAPLAPVPGMTIPDRYPGLPSATPLPPPPAPPAEIVLRIIVPDGMGVTADTPGVRVVQDHDGAAVGMAFPLDRAR